jgi:mono/diheme cytochrome c family protein
MKTTRKMKWTRLALAAVLTVSTTVWAQGKVDLGKREFDTNCASCHGVSGKGNGPLGELLKRSASDLTTLQKRNGGVFPMARTYEIIEGGGVLEHGTRDMPIWGREYSIKAAEYYVDAPYNQEGYVRARILTLLEYVSRLQAK